MKKFLYAVILIILLGGFWGVSSWYNNRKAERGNPSRVKSGTAISDKRSDADTDSSSLSSGTVRISHEKQQIIGVRTGIAEKSSVTRTLRLLGRVAPDETRIFKIKAAVDGIIREVYPGTTGSLVKKEQPLASYYSPEIHAAEQSYLLALRSDRLGSGLQVPVNESRLKFLGMDEVQIEELKKTGKIEETLIVLHAPATGLMLAREVSPELRFQKGEELYRIADLGRVWIFADIYESEARYLRPHVMARVSHPQMDRTYQAQVSDVLPLFDTTTRTLKMRLEMDNPGFVLRPDMFVDIELPIRLPPAVTVPADAILDSGFKKTVFIDLGKGLFEPREVETGWRFNNQVEIIKGLNPGERIAISGTFLIDSESRLELAAAGMIGTLGKDPVCGLNVSVSKAEKAGRKSVYQGKTYYFSSDECKAQFEKSPDQYIKE